MYVLVLGAAGRTGVHIVKQALAKGHTVTAFIQPGQELKLRDPKLRTVVGDARNFKDLKGAMKGQDAVLSALGSSKMNDNLIVQSTQALIDAARSAGVKRILMLSSFIVTPNYRPTGVARLLNIFTRGLVKDKVSGEDLLKQSDPGWTIVYATRLDAAPVGNYHAVEDGEPVTLKNGISRIDVASFMVSQVGSNEYDKKPVLITSI